MLKSLACSVALLFCASAPSARAQNQQKPCPPAPTVVILVRHAEKADAPADDPPLNKAGEQRARLLAGIAAAAGVNAVYSTQAKRTRDTAKPTADALGLTVNVRNVTRATVNAHVAEMEREIRASHGKTVLVVGHSNTVPRVASALTNKPIPNLDEEKEFDAIFVVILHRDDQPQLIRAKY